MKRLVWLILAALSIDAQASEIPAETFFAAPLVQSVGVAPDGSRLAAMTRAGGRKEVSIFTLSDEGVELELRFKVPPRFERLTWLTSKQLGIWSSETRFVEEALTSVLGGNPFVTRQLLYSLQVPSGQPLTVLTQINKDVSPIVARVADSEDHLLVHNWDCKASHTDLHKIDLRDGSSELLAKGKKATST